MINRSILLNIIIWLGLYFGFLLLLGHTNIPRYWILSHRGIAIEGEVINKEPLNHQIIDYSYIVNKNIYKNNWGLGYGNPGFNEVRIGDKIQIFYDPISPESSILGNPREELIHEVKFVFIASIIFSTFGTFIIYIRRIGGHFVWEPKRLW